MLLCTLPSAAVANSEITSSNRDASEEIANPNSIDLLVIYPETEFGTSHVDDLSSDYGEITVDGYLDKLIQHVKTNVQTKIVNWMNSVINHQEFAKNAQENG